MTKRLFIEPPMTEAEAAVRVTPGEPGRRAGVSARTPSQGIPDMARRRTPRAGGRRAIAYDETGAPVVPGREVHIGVSHCPGRVAVCISGAPCAVDVEPESRDFSRAAPRYMSLAERALSDDPLLPAAVWCAKETLYKYAGRPGLDMLYDLHVEAVDFEAGVVVGRIADGEPLRLSLKRADGFIVVYIL